MRRAFPLILLFALAGAIPAPAAPLTAEDLNPPLPEWTELSRELVHNYDLEAQGLRLQVLPLTTELLKAFIGPLSAHPDFPQDPAAQAKLINDLKPRADSILLYIAARDRKAEPDIWSPVFTLNPGDFHIRLAGGTEAVIEGTTSVSTVGFSPLIDARPLEPNDAWRAIYMLQFPDQARWDEFMAAERVMLEFVTPRAPLLLNISAIRADIGPDPDHESLGAGRPQRSLETFFKHFPPREEASAAAESE